MALLLRVPDDAAWEQAIPRFAEKLKARAVDPWSASRAQIDREPKTFYLERKTVEPVIAPLLAALTCSIKNLQDW